MFLVECGMWQVQYGKWPEPLAVSVWGLTARAEVSQIIAQSYVIINLTLQLLIAYWPRDMA